MQDICGISGDFKLRLQVSREAHSSSRTCFMAGSTSLLHSCCICNEKSEDFVTIKQEPVMQEESLQKVIHSKDENEVVHKEFVTLYKMKPSSEKPGEEHPVKRVVDEPYACGVCAQTFRDSTVLKNHLRFTHRGHKDNLYQCSVCGKQFMNLANVNQHLLIHIGDKPHKCKLCSSEYFRLAELTRHMRIHTGQKNYFCNICFKSFTWSHSLKRHLRVHTGERPYVCVFCGNTYKDYGHLRRHKRLHTGEQAYKCHACAQNFRYRKLLIGHNCVEKGHSSIF